jgi:hypothetical protein
MVFDQWHDEKLELVTIPNTPENLARVHKISAFHSNFMQNIIDFIPGNFHIEILTQPFASSQPDVLRGKTASQAKNIFSQYLAFLNAAKEWDMDFIDFTKFQLLPDGTLHFGWELKTQTFPDPASFIPIFKKNTHLRELNEQNYLHVLKKADPASVPTPNPVYLCRNEDFASNLLHAHSLSNMKSNVTVRIHTQSPWQDTVIRNNLFHNLHGEEILLLKIDNQNQSLSEYLSALCGLKKSRKENPAAQADAFRLFLQQSVFQKIIMLIDNLEKKEDARLLRFLLESGDISAMIVVLFNDSAPFDCDLEFNEDPQNQLEKHFPARSRGAKQPQTSRSENELLEKIAMIGVPLPMAAARLLAGRAGDKQIAALLKKNRLTKNKNQQTLALNGPFDIAAVPVQKKNDWLALLATKTDWAYAQISYFITTGQWTALEQYLKKRAVAFPGRVAPGPAADLLLSHLPQLAANKKIVAYFWIFCSKAIACNWPKKFSPSRRSQLTSSPG